MNRKIIGIFVVTLLIATAIPVIGINENVSNSVSSTLAGINRNEFEPQDVPDSWLEGADQYQTSNSNYGLIISPTFLDAQEFKPTQDKLTAVAIYLFSYYAPSGIEITVAIRESLDGSDLITKTIDADSKNIKEDGKWIMFDFEDITVIPEETYYIVCSASGGQEELCYCWFFDINNKYDRGIAWQSNDSGITWYDLEEDPWGDPEFVEWDTCFITYYLEPPKNKAVNTPFLRFLENHPYMFPLLRQLLGL